ncbi:hypothetical protein [Massilia soli]|uniref:Peptidase M50 domain-containing protein n=1 Tax=Massilia soli TaxID=2792854 RepID=A0ABS7ST64_9BURK|nr:hypothetical protein [Massilia soli]MBZ2209148.1 hypothetical protein [Massilia soli]
MKKARLFGLQFYITLFIAGVVTTLAHELGHWAVGKLFGFEMSFRLNGVSTLSPVIPFSRAMFDLGGPAVTVLQGVVAYAVLKRTQSQLAFAFLYQAAFMRVVASLVSLYFLNDEARLSLYFGLPAWTLPALVSGLLVVLAWAGSKRIGTTWKDQLLCYLVASVTVAAVVGTDMVLFR